MGLLQKNIHLNQILLSNTDDKIIKRLKGGGLSTGVLEHTQFQESKWDMRCME